MATGLTCDIENGQTFEEFVWRCARQMGAFIHMRDDSLDARLRMPDSEKEAGGWHREELAKARKKLNGLKTMTDEEADIMAKADHIEILKCHEQCDDSSDSKREAYEAMLAKVKAWRPPTPTHEGLKNLMIQQIEDSIRFDCHEPSDPPEPLTGREWREQRLERAERDIEYHSRELAAAIERARERREWIEALIKDVPIPAQLRPLEL